MRRPLRLGFPVKVMGRPDMPSNDTRGWRKNPHLKTSLELLDRVLDYLSKVRIDMYRMSSDIAPYATHPDMPQFHDMVAESDAELAAFGRKARQLDIRLSFHPSQFVLLNSPDEALTLVPPGSSSKSSPSVASPQAETRTRATIEGRIFSVRAGARAVLARDDGSFCIPRSYGSSEAESTPE